jgi:hypothetical protein
VTRHSVAPAAEEDSAEEGEDLAAVEEDLAAVEASVEEDLAAALEVVIGRRIL